jgi:hypothetical protein
MPDTYACPVCGAAQEHMVLPRWFTAEDVRLFRLLERNMACLDCDGGGVPLPDDD